MQVFALSSTNIRWHGFFCFYFELEYMVKLQEQQPNSQLPLTGSWLIIVPFGQIAALQQAYDGLRAEKGTTAFPYFLMKYTADTVQVAPLADWDAFFTDTKKVSKLFCCVWFHDCSWRSFLPSFICTISWPISVIRWDLVVTQTHTHFGNIDPFFLQVTVGVYDPCTLSQHPGWPLRNLLVLLANRW